MDDEISLQYGTIGNIYKQTHCQKCSERIKYIPNGTNVYYTSNCHFKSQETSASVAQ